MVLSGFPEKIVPTFPETETLTSTIIAAAIEVHRCLGPGLLESIYEDCLAEECLSRGLEVRRQVEVPVLYKGRRLQSVYRLDLIINNAVVVEVKAIEAILGVHKAQVLTYLKLTGMRLGLLHNFNVPVLRNGVTRLIL